VGTFVEVEVAVGVTLDVGLGVLVTLGGAV
jgi:hypothetical protein